MSFSDDLKNNSIWIGGLLVISGLLSAFSLISWVDAKIDEKVKAQFEKNKDQQIIQSLPIGAVVAFDSVDVCPNGWANFDAARGRILLGAGDRIIRQHFYYNQINKDSNETESVSPPLDQKLKKQRPYANNAQSHTFASPPTYTAPTYESENHYYINSGVVYALNTYNIDGPEYIGVKFCKKLHM